MTGRDDFDRLLAGWFEADALAPAAAGDLKRVVDSTRRRRPHPAWLANVGSHWVGEIVSGGSGSGVRSIASLGQRWSTAFMVLLAIVVIVAGAILVGALLLRNSPLPAGRIGHLAYGLNGDIFVADWDGRNAIRIADGPGDGEAGCGSFEVFGSMWSPDGRYLVYRSDHWNDVCRGTVYLTDPDGHQVASFPGSGWLVSWSPDSTRVATWVELSKTIGIYGIDGVRDALLALPTGYGVPGDFDPRWSPDGKSLLIKLSPYAPSEAPPTSMVGPSEVWEIPVDGGMPRPVPTNDPRSKPDAVFSRDWSRVAFNEDGYLVVAAADGTQRRLLAQAGIATVWSPTGDRVAFTWGFDFEEPPTSLRMMDVASGNVWEIGGGGMPIGFSPEGDRILYSRTTRNREANRNESSLWSVNVETFRILDGSEGRSGFNGDSYEFDAQQLVSGITWGDWQWQPADR